jgi:uncharacterized phage protein (TIGR02218 family)
MKTVSGALQTLFNSRQWVAAKLFTFTLVDGTVLNYCSADTNLVWSGTTYLYGGSTGPYWDRASNKAKATFGLGATTTQLVFDCIMGSGTAEGLPFATAIRYGLFDGADLQYSRAFMSPSAPTTVVGTVLMFGGGVAEVDFSNTIATFTCNSYLDLLNQNLPRNLFQPGCNNTLFDASCTLSQGAFSFSGAVTGSSSTTAFGVSGAAAGKANGYFNLGKVKFTSGVNNGFWRGVQSFVSGSPPVMTVFPPYAQAPTAGDTFTAVAGCDKQQTTCVVKFSNLQNYRGTPYVPSYETAI